MSTEKLGLSHSLPEDALVVHSTVLGVNSLGRITDLLSAWCKRELKLENKFLSDFRLVLQGLLEFSCPKDGEALGQIELADDGNSILVATRFPCQVPFHGETITKDLTQYWLNSDEVKLLKRMLNPDDRVEVRHHAKLNLIEWRVCRPKDGTTGLDVDHASFQVLSDHAADLNASKVQYCDLGDLPYADWLSDSYKNKKSGTRAGKVVVEAGESHDDQEWARVVVDREQKDLEDELAQILQNEVFETDEVTQRFSASPKETVEEQVFECSALVPVEEIEVILSQNIDQSEKAKDIARRIRKLELMLEQERTVAEQRLKQSESMVRRKEYVNQRHLTEINELHTALSELKKKKEIAASGASGGKSGEHFKLKALEMYEALKKVKEEKKELERMLNDSRSRDAEFLDVLSQNVSATDAGAFSSVPTAAPITGNSKQQEDLAKRADRLQRALEAEKLKVKNLSERVIVAEKDAQSAAPMVKDLESKVEATLKAVQVHKKETEVVKQKLVQSDAEKNRIKNDLVKANAQIQTLMKRQAA